MSCKAMIFNILMTLHSMELELDKRNSQNRHTLTNDKFDGIDTWLEASPRESLCLFTFQCWVQRMNGPIHFSKTLNSKRYVRLILLPFFDLLAKGEELYGHFIQDDSLAHNVETINKKVYTMYYEEIVCSFCSICK